MPLLNNLPHECTRKLILLAPIAFLGYTIAMCPCEKLGSCHIKQIYAAMLVELLLLQVEIVN